MIVYRHTDPRFPFLWEGAGQPSSRWVEEGDGPINTFADTPEGAWAELLRHEGIVDREDVREIRRSMWAVEIGEPPAGRPRLPKAVLTGGVDTYEICRREAARLRAKGERGFTSPSAALLPGGAHGWRVDGGLRWGPRRDGRVVVLFGARPDLVGWEAAFHGRPHEAFVERVRPLA